MLLNSASDYRTQRGIRDVRRVVSEVHAEIGYQDTAYPAAMRQSRDEPT